LIDEDGIRVVLRKTAVNQRALPASGDAGDGCEDPLGNLDRDVAQIVERGVLDEEMPSSLRAASLSGPDASRGVSPSGCRSS
jgi:hypothetical protein